MARVAAAVIFFFPETAAMTDSDANDEKPKYECERTCACMCACLRVACVCVCARARWRDSVRVLGRGGRRRRCARLFSVYQQMTGGLGWRVCTTLPRDDRTAATEAGAAVDDEWR